MLRIFECFSGLLKKTFSIFKTMIALIIVLLILLIMIMVLIAKGMITIRILGNIVGNVMLMIGSRIIMIAVLFMSAMVIKSFFFVCDI